jgi:3D (Asp-Asp-Asp) domain-containing protein
MFRVLKFFSAAVCSAVLVTGAASEAGVVPWFEPGTFLRRVQQTVTETAPVTEPETAPESIPEIIPEEPAAYPIDREPDSLWSLGEFKITAYCPCEKCCGYWATVRPADENGEPIVYTASGKIAAQGVTVAADTSILPFGTVLVIGGHEYTVQDRGGMVKGGHVDIYFDSHEAAKEWGTQYMEIFVKEAVGNE